MTARIALALALASAAGLASGCEHDEARPAGPTASAAASSPGTPSLPESSVPDSAPTELVRPGGFDLVAATLTSPDGVDASLRLWLASTPDQQRRGLMGVTDLGSGDGMLFDFGASGQYRFYMWQTPMPLDIVFFDEARRFAGAATMTPCLGASPATCDRYTPERPFLTAIELPAGAIEELGVDIGWTLTYSREPLPADRDGSTIATSSMAPAPSTDP